MFSYFFWPILKNVGIAYDSYDFFNFGISSSTQVYCYSGGFVGTVLTDCLALLSAVVSDKPPEERAIDGGSNQRELSCWIFFSELHEQLY